MKKLMRLFMISMTAGLLFTACDATNDVPDGEDPVDEEILDEDLMDEELEEDIEEGVEEDLEDEE